MDTTEYISVFKSPIGCIEITANTKNVVSIHFIDEDISEISNENHLNKECQLQLEEYFVGKRKIFDFAFDQQGTNFQQKVWKALLDIPYGDTTSYLALSKTLGDVKAIRAVGTANGKNKLAIIVPCHRVIGSNNKLVGYAGGLWRKEWLLKHELSLSGIKEGQLF